LRFITRKSAEISLFGDEAITLTDFEQLKELIEVLKMAQKYGFSSKSSPIDLLLEAFIDLSLMLGKLFKEGAKARRNNPGLKFLDMSDELGNPKQLKVFTPSKLYWDPWTSEIFKSLASFGVLVKRLKPGKASFMEAFSGLSFTIPPKALSPPEKHRLEKKSQFELKQARRAYYRRQSRKSKNH
jgi:hypothetical protein